MKPPVRSRYAEDPAFHSTTEAVVPVYKAGMMTEAMMPEMMSVREMSKMVAMAKMGMTKVVMAEVAMTEMTKTVSEGQSKMSSVVAKMSAEIGMVSSQVNDRPAVGVGGGWENSKRHTN
jgi:hypothetical protein